MRKKNTSIIFFQEGEKTDKMAIFLPPLHKSKLNFHALIVDSQNVYEFTT